MVSKQNRKTKLGAITYGTAKKDHLALQKRIEIEALTKSDIGKRVMSEALASAIIHLRVLLKLELKGELGSEESRGIPGTISTIRRLCDSLGLVEQIDEWQEDL